MIDKYQYDIPSYPEYVVDYLVPFLIALRKNFSSDNQIILEGNCKLL